MTAATESDLREIEALIGKLEWSVSYESPGHQDDARAALLAAVRKEIAATRAERDAFAALVDEVIRDSTPPRLCARRRREDELSDTVYCELCKRYHERHDCPALETMKLFGSQGQAALDAKDAEISRLTAENAALVKLVDDLAAIEYRTFGGIGPLDGEEDAVIALIDRAQALRAGQQKEC